MAAMNINKEQFDKAMESGKAILVDFWAPWCSYCRRIGPAYDKVAAQYADHLEVVKVNIDEEPQLAELEQIEVIPALILYRDGQAVDSIVAPDSKAMIDAFLRKALEV